MVDIFASINHVNIPYYRDKRRPGDIAACYADPTKAEKVLGWHAELDLEDMCRDAWNWQKNNPSFVD